MNKKTVISRKVTNEKFIERNVMVVKNFSNHKHSATVNSTTAECLAGLTSTIIVLTEKYNYRSTD